MRITSFTLFVLCLGLLTVAAYRSVRIALADRLYFSGTSESVRSATILEPGNALYHAGRAELLAGSGQDPQADLERSVDRNPDDADLRIRLGLYAEEQGDHQRAETELLEAARLSRKYAPRWTLANYYFRRGDTEAFWRWAREALETSYASRRPLFELCHRVSPSPKLVLERAVSGCRAVRLDYASFLGELGQWPLAGELLRDLARDASDAESPRLLGMTNYLLAAQEFESSRAVWNSLSRLGRLPYPPLKRGASSVSLRNGDFAHQILNAGFGWRLPAADGVYLSQLGPAGLSITLSGEWMSDAEILYQYFPVEPAQFYRFEYFYRNSLTPVAGASPESGLEWRIQFPGTGEPWRSASNFFQPGNDNFGAIDLLTPRGASVARIVLFRHRERGATPLGDNIVLQRVTLQHRGHFQAQ